MGFVETENIMDSIMEKLKELQLWLENIGEPLLDKFNGLFPPETRDERLHYCLLCRLEMFEKDPRSYHRNFGANPSIHVDLDTV
ncbi:hypothetical protein RJ641_003166 [Dillenia turbinata]|uniref:Uncharacterized protein n=1 Tax=Dillenia turbinata TaxID=194707 RepID=A0AAN8VAI8_9MAGN